MKSPFLKPNLLRLAGGLALLLVAASACSSSAPSPAPTASPAPALTTAAPAASPTSQATATLAPSETAAPLPTLTLSPSPAPSATPSPDFGKAKILAVVTGQVGGIQVSVSVPNLVAAENLILGGVKFTCQLDAKNRMQLDCWGLATPAYDTPITIAFLDPASGKVDYEGKTQIFSGVAAGKKIYSGTSCPNAGQNQSCEVECRVDPNTNQPCIVASCFDACGDTYAIQTCSDAVPLKQFSMCDGSTMAEMKKRYNIP